MLSIDLGGTVTVVIGGSRGIGAAVCRTIAQAGGDVAWTHTGSARGAAASATLAAEIEALDRRCMHSAVEATDEAATESFLGEVAGALGRIDALVYNAGFTSPVAMDDLTVEQWRRNVDLNLNGAFIAAQGALARMDRGGAIVLIGSAAVHSGGGGRADYVSAKAGLEGLCRAITKEYAPRGVRCNVVHPSLIETDLLTTRYPDPADRARVAEQVPLRRLGRPEDIAYITAFLLSGRASYITGQSLLVDGGRTFCR